MKKFFAAIAFIFCLFLVSCKTKTTNYKITYHDEGTITEIEYSPNEVIPNKDILGSSKEGYELEGWYFDASYSSIVPFPYTVTESKDFYARWIQIHTVTLMNGTVTLKTEKVKAGQTFSNPGNPQITGAGTFKGWSSSKDEYVPFDFNTKIEQNVVLYAFFEKPTPSTITVSFMDGDTLVETKEIQKNTVVSKATAPAKADQTFKGWSSDKDEYVEFNFETKLTEDTTLYAFYTNNTVTPETITVTFKNGDAVLETKEIEKDSTISEITAPTQTGYTFKGWSTNENEYAEFDFASKVESDLVLYAFFEINSYTVTYKYNDTTYTTQTVDYNSATDAPKAPVITGYIFIEWCTDNSCETAYDFTTKITSDITLYAKLDPVTTHTLTLVIDGKQSQVQINDNFTIDSVDVPLNAGYEVKTWYTDANYSTPFDSTTKITKDTTLYGKATIKSYTVTFINESTTLSTKTVEYNAVITLPSNPSKTGYTFKGWSTKEKEYVEFNKNLPITEDVTLYAYYTINTYTVTFKDGETTLSTATVDYNTTVKLPTLSNKTGYTCKGWSTNATSFVEFNANTKITSNTTIYAYYEIQTFTVTFMNGSTTVSTKTVNYDSTVTLPTAPTKTGYTFKGWSTNTTTYAAFNASTKITSNTTLYAFFDIQTFKVTFMNGNTKISEETVDYNSTASVPSNPSKTGWVFKGWSTNENTLVPFNTNTKITSNTTIYAYFIEEFTVTFNVEGTKTTVKVESGNKVTEPEAPTKSGYTFTGWYLDNTKFNFNTPITDSIELVAGFVSEQDAPIEVTKYSGYNEGLFFEATPVVGASLSDYSVQYKLASNSASSWKTIDQQLIREQNNKIRCDIIGLPAGSYQVKIDVVGKTRTIACEVSEDDRSGYAHFNYTSGIGAYNNDGTLKSNAVVVYVTDSTKNTVKATIGGKEYTGLVNIVKAATNKNYALDIRILGEIQTTQWNFKEHGTGKSAERQANLDATFNFSSNQKLWDSTSSGNYYKLNEAEIKSLGINSMSADEAKGITQLKGLTNQVLRDKTPDKDSKVCEYDSYYNMLDVADAYNITIEGIGTDAAIFQWGFAFKKCNSIEIKNLRFHDYTEDAVGFEGNSKDIDYGNYWVHNCTFDIGVNNWDVCYENDKKDGDGSSDVKYCHNVTISYVQY
ncbi:MAG: InlB B-repeat-containing protein, partial [Anaeroplasmataceae bacterium]|nr:InlB B-repeat-containing protein [Anaeroplasmataceae bacterium]